MFQPLASLLSTLVVLPVLLAQKNNSTSSSGSAVAASAQNGTTTATDTTAAAGSFAPTTFTPSLASGTTCGTVQQNFNQCITKVGKDISSCTNNVCLCQTYANIASCYNGCAQLAEQGKQYQSQSTQYCTIAGVKPNTTVDTPTSTTTPNASSTSNISSAGNNTSSTTSSNASTFSAAKGSAVQLAIHFNSPQAVGGLVASLAILFL